MARTESDDRSDGGRTEALRPGGTLPSPVEIFARDRALRRLLILGVIFLILAVYFYRQFNPDRPVDYDDIREHFKYGSIGSEPVNGLPIWLLKALPIVFADKLPGEGLSSIGFIEEEGRELPIGFSKRRVFIDRAWLNCSVCHTGTVRDTPGVPPRIYLGMPANTVDLQALIDFLVACAQDHRFTPDHLMPVIEEIGDLGLLESFLYRSVLIPTVREALLEAAHTIAFQKRQPGRWGPGRVDTFNPYKIVQFNFPMDKLPDSEIIGISDLPSIWLQRKRVGMDLHWDGNNSSVEERNKSAALGAGVTPTTIDLDRIKRIEDWLWDLEPPRYPYEIDSTAAALGAEIYGRECASCHGKDGRDFTGAEVGKVVPIEQIQTDRHRLDSYTRVLSVNQNTLYSGYPWRFTQFRKTNGYANSPLDGVWLRGPYLHNGSVPSLRDLLEPPENRPEVFYRGYDVFDRERVGFISTVAQENGRAFFRYDTRLPGNGNQGHLYGLALTGDEKDALVEYLKGF